MEFVLDRLVRGYIFGIILSVITVFSLDIGSSTTKSRCSTSSIRSRLHALLSSVLVSIALGIFLFCHDYRWVVLPQYRF